MATVTSNQQRHAPHDRRLRPASGVVVRDGRGRVLLLRRQGEDTWGIPGGGVELGETWAAAAERECREETGWIVRIEELLGVYSDPGTQTHRYPSGRSQQLVGVVLLATPVRRERPTDDEAAEVCWADPDELPQPIFGPDVPVLSDALDPDRRGPVIR